MNHHQEADDERKRTSTRGKHPVASRLAPAWAPHQHRHGLAVEWDDGGTSRTQHNFSSSWWQSYVSWVQRNRHHLIVWESLVDRLLWLVPGQRQEGWRQILWSAAELQHLALDVALDQDESLGNGCTLETGTISTNTTTTLGLRLALTILHTLWPVLYQGLSTHPKHSHRQAYWKLQLERVRLLLRVALWLPHWWRHRNGRVPPGILARGGLLLGSSSSLSLPPTPTVAHQARRLAYHNYVGHRTGRNVLRGAGGSGRGVVTTTTRPQLSHGARVLVGEVLHLLRPLFWAYCQYRCSRDNNTDGNNSNSYLWKSWLLSLGLDVTSLACLAPIANTDEQQHDLGNAATAAEWQRRQWRLLLYFLRSPCHDQVTTPVVDHVQGVLAYLPVLGNLLTAYLQDWLYYWKVYHLEE